MLTDNQARLGLSLFTDTTLSETEWNLLWSPPRPQSGLWWQTTVRALGWRWASAGRIGLPKFADQCLLADIPALAFVTQGSARPSCAAGISGMSGRYGAGPAGAGALLNPLG